jgi:hypothetical protein
MIGAPKGCCSAGSLLIFSSVGYATRRARLMFRDRAMVFDQAPIVLPAAECAAHWYLASSEHDEIACLSAELRFQVAASRRARELYAGLYAHRDTPPLARRSVRSALLSCVCARLRSSGAVERNIRFEPAHRSFGGIKDYSGLAIDALRQYRLPRSPDLGSSHPAFLLNHGRATC